MNAIEQPRNENHRVTPPPPAFDEAVYADIFNSAPLPTPEELAASAEAKNQLEKSFSGDNPDIQKLDAQKARAERAARDQKAANDISDEIKKSGIR